MTDAHLATAFEDARAESLLLRAREARLRRDSSLVSYDARAYQRASIGMGFKAIGRDRLLVRHEAVTRVRWRRGHGAVIDVLGSRFAVPPVMGGALDVDDTEIPGIPYYPGRDDFWFGFPATLAEREDATFIHPIAEGAEAYYRYALGDSASFRLQDGTLVRIVELRVRPREPSWRLAVGSLWFDDASAQLVRAVYRLAAPLEGLIQLPVEGGNPLLRGAIETAMKPSRATLESLVIEHGLYEGRYWLPRVQVLEGNVQLSFARVPIRIEERFDYHAVNGVLDSLPDVPEFVGRALDSLRADSLGLQGEEREQWMRERLMEFKGSCDGLEGERLRGHARHGREIPTLVRLPCDTIALKSSPELPPSIFEESEAIMSREDLQQVQEMLGFGANAPFAPQAPTLYFGPGAGLLRYNRIEGISVGLGGRSELGAGFAAEARAQIGTADLEPNGELALERSAGARSWRLAGYRRLNASTDWGTPLSFGASLNALLFGLDEGFYHRAHGAELVAVGTGDERLEWRVFAERHEIARRETHFSLANALHGLGFDANIEADEGTLVGAEARLTRTFGVDPRGTRLFADLRLEGATGDFTFLRGTFDATLSRALSRHLAAALTVGGGSTTGEVPLQRHFFLGGTQTVRGQPAGTAIGPAYWLGRVELGTGILAARPVLFYDIGWAGDRNDWRNPGRPLSGAGVGVSFLDGLVRLDVARGIWPRRRWTAGLYLEARF